VKYIDQADQGLAHARNTGWRAAASACVVFLDADDLLLPHALTAGLACVERHPRGMFVSGHHEFIGEPGTALPAWRDRRHADDQSFTSGNLELILPNGRRAGKVTPTAADQRSLHSDAPAELHRHELLRDVPPNRP